MCVCVNNIRTQKVDLYNAHIGGNQCAEYKEECVTKESHTLYFYTRHKEMRSFLITSRKSVSGIKSSYECVRNFAPHKLSIWNIHIAPLPHTIFAEAENKHMGAGLNIEYAYNGPPPHSLT